MKVAIVHDYLNQYGGAERVIEVMHEIFPEAPVFTSIYQPENMPDSFKKMDIRVTFMQKFPFLDRFYKKYFMLYPIAMKSLKVKDFDIIISSSSSFAKGVKKRKNAVHVCYCYTPTRFIWYYNFYIKKENFTKIISTFLLPLFIKSLKKWDLKAVEGVDKFIAISNHIKNKIKACYKRDSEVIYPPVDFEKFKINEASKERGSYFLVVSRLNAYKNIDMAINACKKLNQNLKIIGTGLYLKELKKIAGDSKKIEFLGRVSDEELCSYYSGCRALIFPGEEDFGISPLEAQASGRPVIAYAKGGALETIIDGETGIFFKEDNEDSLSESISDFINMENNFIPEVIRKHALKFDKEVFKKSLKAYIDNIINGNQIKDK
ncbi:MAG: glycosyltransferase family 4 protein [Actinobacteria bacterium]|nr:glycosyltransferase family 4 protein [Actinomycetota bacterium]